ncbi:MAG TPA: F0F1 ATP synthase subunit delta [Candidatus Dormibacteraeota bacterium]|nr:F0F1 ATP synthase subunit delta [Candidatus Dormibacteraeota bacterium]
MATAAAKRYARAVFELAQQDGQLEQWARRLERVRELLSDPNVAAVLRNPTIDRRQREAFVVDVPGLDREATNLARLLVESGRIDEAAAIEDEFQRLADDAAGRVRATATTAIELGSRDRERVAEQLSRELKQDVRLTVVVDPRVIGGMRLQYGDHVVDATVAARLEQLRRRLAAT